MLCYVMSSHSSSVVRVVCVQRVRHSVHPARQPELASATPECALQATVATPASPAKVLYTSPAYCITHTAVLPFSELLQGASKKVIP